MHKFFTILFFSISTLSLHAQGEIAGTWFNTTKSGKIEIVQQGDNFFGKIVWLKEPLDEKTGKAKVDENNPEQSKRSAPIIGLQILKNFEYDGEGKYSGGSIYDPENGKTYKCKMTLVDKDKLDVRGYIGFPALGRTENWTRANK